MNPEHNNWLKSVLNLRSSVIPAIKQQVFLSMIFALLITLSYQRGFHSFHQPALAGLIPGIVLGLLLVFRTNTAYERFWEGWKLAGALVFTGRNLARKILINVPQKSLEDFPAKITHMRLVGGFYTAFNLHLRRESVNDRLKEIVSPDQYAELQTATNMPLKIAKWLSDYIDKLYNQKYIDTIQLEAHNKLLDQLVEILSCCERILAAPMPNAYSTHLRHLLILYCFALPFQLVKDLHWWTIPTVGIVTFALFGIEAIGLEIENPFGYDANDIPLDNLAKKLQNDIEQLIDSHTSRDSLEELLKLPSTQEN
ncbi:bestrophin family protein [Allocoleopsis sp.]|uniref:bestrophin family protein n=1 Tax=Allocoleopsis sp. TaxID=3088169 RepID=UPI002FD32F68